MHGRPASLPRAFEHAPWSRSAPTGEYLRSSADEASLWSDLLLKRRGDRERSDRDPVVVLQHEATLELEERREALRLVFETLAPASGKVSRSQLRSFCAAYGGPLPLEKTLPGSSPIGLADFVAFFDALLPRGLCAFHVVSRRFLDVARDLRLASALDLLEVDGGGSAQAAPGAAGQG
eukprot:TRINITY_DN73721_c0_g1_i1.p2 TRINITY_DN73721_c0_g1~~TRINITY_DN73721_c0_g1_i1.p2  ORF type:complete len:178 (-),score=35.68 TRINITY_DN73721_c0_g1_i1:293-826(-)